MVLASRPFPSSMGWMVTNQRVGQPRPDQAVQVAWRMVEPRQEGLQLPFKPCAPGGLEVDELRGTGTAPRRRHHHGAVAPQGPGRKDLPPHPARPSGTGPGATGRSDPGSGVPASLRPLPPGSPHPGPLAGCRRPTRPMVVWRPSRSSIDARTASRSRDTPSMALLLTTSRAMATRAASPAVVRSTALTTPRSSDWARRARSRGTARAPESHVNPAGHPGNSQMKVCSVVARVTRSPVRQFIF